jgi:hypothetical protein
VPIGLGGGFSLRIGAGGVIGSYRNGPATFEKPVFAFGAKEMIEFGFGFKEVYIGVRVEQQQLWQDYSGFGLDHVTSGLGFVGVRFD